MAQLIRRVGVLCVLLLTRLILPMAVRWPVATTHARALPAVTTVPCTKPGLSGLNSTTSVYSSLVARLWLPVSCPL